MCEVHYLRIKCSSPAAVKEATGCYGKVREKLFERSCVQYCEIKKIIEEGREGKKKWKDGVCLQCRKEYPKMGLVYDDSRIAGLATNPKKRKVGPTVPKRNQFKA